MHFNFGSWLSRLKHHAGIVWSLLGVLALILVWGRLSGALSDPLPLSSGCAVTAVGMGFCLWRYLHCSGRADANAEWKSAMTALGALVPALLMGLALLPNRSTAGLVCLLILFASAGVAIALGNGRPRRREDDDSLPERLHPLPDRGWSEGPPDREESGAIPIRTPPDERTVQWFRRTRRLDGAESIEGVVEVQFHAGQSQATVHVPFSPPLTGSPEINCEILDNVPARAKVGALQPFGARIEIRRPRSAEKAAAVQVGFTAETAARSRAA